MCLICTLLVALTAPAWSSAAIEEHGFRALAPLVAGENASAVAVGNLNADVLRDIVVADGASATVSFFMATGPDTFAEPAVYDVGDTPSSVVIGKIDSGSTYDVAVLDTGSDDVTILYGETEDDAVTPSGTFSVMSYEATYDWYSNLLSAPSDLAYLTMSGQDGFAITNPALDNVTIMRWRTSDEDYTASTTYAVGDEPVAISSSATGGGLVVANHGSDSISVLRATGYGTYEPAVSYPAGPAPSDVLVTDVTGDLVPDAIVANSTSNEISVLTGNPDGTFAPRVVYPTVAGPKSLAVSSRGALTVSVAGQSSVGAMHVDGGALRRPVPAATGIAPNAIESANVAGDSSSDIVVANADGTLRILVAAHPSLTWNPTLTFSYVHIGAPAPAAQSITVANSGPVPVLLEHPEQVALPMPPAVPSRSAALDPQFPMTANACNGRTLQPGETCQLSFTFVPTAAGSRTTHVGFVTTPTDEGATRYGTLYGSAVLPPTPPDPAPQLTVSGLNRLTLRQLASRRITLTIQPSQPCTLQAQARLYVAGSKTHPVLATLTRRLGTSRTKVTLSISKRNLAVISRAVKRRHAVTVRVTLSARDATGHSRTLIRTIRITS